MFQTKFRKTSKSQMAMGKAAMKKLQYTVIKQYCIYQPKNQGEQFDKMFEPFTDFCLTNNIHTSSCPVPFYGNKI